MQCQQQATNHRLQTVFTTHQALTTIKGQELTLDNIGEIANKMLVHLDGLNKPAVETVLNWIKNSVDETYFFSTKPINAGKS